MNCPCDRFSGPRQDRVPNSTEGSSLERRFPRLRRGYYCLLEGNGNEFQFSPGDYTDQSHRNPIYSCYGWAVGDTTGDITEQVIVERYGERHYSGEDSIRMTDLYAFYSQHGFPDTRRSASADIIIYGTGEVPKHAARKSSIQCEGGRMYTSKLGNRGPLIAHLPHQLEGGVYGNIMGWFTASSADYRRFRTEPLEDLTREGRRRASRRPPR